VLGFGIVMRSKIRQALIICAALGPFGTALAEEPTSVSLQLSRGPMFDERGGAALFANVCAACHQPEGTGASGAATYPSLRENKSLVSAEYLVKLLLNGRKDMPAVGEMMNDQQIADVINYVRTHFGNAYRDRVSPNDVGAARRQVSSSP
jgi:mono/diheme cytochrome c family protein